MSVQTVEKCMITLTIETKELSSTQMFYFTQMLNNVMNQVNSCHSLIEKRNLITTYPRAYEKSDPTIEKI